tara:strand:+ start:967 stop:1257 length:291 start_codon:yes stop_codon:yes gene_type:complete
MPDYQVTWDCEVCGGEGHTEDYRDRTADCVECDGRGVIEKRVTNYSSIWECAEDYKDAVQIANMEYVFNKNVSHKIVSFERKIVSPKLNTDDDNEM